MTFEWHGQTLDLFDHPYNGTITNERAVEIPIALAFLERVEGDGLELGNVLGHYGCRTPRRFVDRYEQGVYVSNLDVFAIDGQYDWIVSISTLEHVRRDEDVQNPWGAVAALAYLRGLLREGGRMLVTIGLGQNPVLDEFLLDGTADDPLGARVSVMVRDRSAPSKGWDEWWEDWPSKEQRAYGPTHGANAVWIGEWGPT